MKVLSVYNLKGGVGKTNLVWALSYLYSQQGKHILSIDLDSQRNLTYSFGVLPQAEEQNILFGLLDNDLTSNIVKSAYWGDIIPAHSDLDSLGINTNSKEPEYLLRDNLKKIRKAYDLIIIDCPPGLGLSNVNALCACDYLITPCNVEAYSIQGLYSLNNAIQQARKKNKKLKWLGVICTDYKPRQNITKQLEAQLDGIADELGIPVLNTPIRYSVKVKEAIAQGTPLTACSSQEDYFALSQELSALIKL